MTFVGDLDIPMRRHDLIMEINLRAPLIAIREAVPHMRASGQGGRIVNVSSLAALDPIPGLMSYGVSKIGLERLTVDAARQLAKDGIAVNCFRIDVPVASEGFVANTPDSDHSTWEPAEVATEGICWMLRQPASYSGRRESVAELRRREGIMPRARGSPMPAAPPPRCSTASPATPRRSSADHPPDQGAAVKFAISLGMLNPRVWPDVTQEADRLGYDSVWLPEHLVFPVETKGSPFHGADHPPVPADVPVFDAFTYLGFLAGRTERIRFSTHVYNIGLRHPFVPARAVATLDIVSGGRAEFGIGASWLRAEWDAVGLDFDSRGRRVDEALDVCRRLWTESEVEHHGEFFDFEPVMFEPKPVQQP